MNPSQNIPVQAVVYADEDLQCAVHQGAGARAAVACTLVDDVVRFGRTPDTPGAVARTAQLWVVETLAHALPTTGSDAHALLLVQARADLPPAVRAFYRLAGTWVELACDGIVDLHEIFSRNHGVLETDALASKRVAIVGSGSMGSIIADMLVKSGVPEIDLIDFDRLDIHNIGRHLCDTHDIGRRKTHAVADRLRARNPRVQVTCWDFNVLDDRSQTRAVLQNADVIVAVTDNNPSRLLLNRIAREEGIPIIFSRAYRRACGGDVIRVKPHDGPCYACLIRDRIVEEEVTHSDAPAYSDVPMVAEPGLALDIEPISTMAARLVIQELVRGTDSSLTSLDADLPASLMLWANRRDDQFASWEPASYRVDGVSVQRWYSVRADAKPDCDVCHPDAFLAGLGARIAADAARRGL